MPRDDFTDAALILLGHGSTKNGESSAPVCQHASELRRRGLFAEVHEAFWKQEPQVTRILPTLLAPRLFIVPLFISEGYFSDEVIPAALGFHGRSTPSARSRSGESGMIFYCKPIGTHESVTEVLLSRAAEVTARFPFPRPPAPRETTLFIAGHGTGRNENSRQAVEDQVERIRARGEFASVQGVFMEEEPRISACYDLAPTRYVVVVPFFMSDGLHTREDIPVLLGEPEPVVRQRLASGLPVWRNPTERRGKLVWYTPAVGTAPRIAEVILERVREAARQGDFNPSEAEAAPRPIPGTTHL